MPSFSENFERSERNDVQFDDNAFYPVIASCIIFTLIFVTYYLYKSLTNELKYCDEKVYSNCHCIRCKPKMKRLNGRLKMPRWKIGLSVLCVIGLLLGFYLCYYKINSTQSQVKTFDPYEILNISNGAQLREIKRAYKILALKYHPDKNLNNLQAKAKFMLVTKAYRALTDEDSKKNYDLYGNPDGPSSMKVSVGLPSFILEKKNHMAILIVFLFSIIGFIPFYFFKWFKKTQLYDANGFLNTTNEKFFVLTDMNSTLYHIPFFLGLSKEFSSFKIPKEEVEVIEKTFTMFPQCMPQYGDDLSLSEKKAIVISYCYAYQTPIELKDVEDYIYLLGKLIDQFFLIQLQKYFLFLQYQHGSEMLPKEIQPVHPEFMRHILLFQQFFFQAISIQAITNPFHPYAQLPYFNPSFLVNNPHIQSIVDFNDFIKLSKDEQRSNLALWFGFNTNQIEEITKAISAIPVYEYDLKYSVEGFDDFVIGDLVTYTLTIKRANLERSRIGIGHSINYPGLFNECIQITIINGGRVLFQEKVQIVQRNTTFDFQLKMGNVGHCLIQFDLMSTCYRGIDQVIDSEINVLQQSQKRKESIKKREAKKVKLELSFFQNMLKEAGMFNDCESEDEEEEISKFESHKEPALKTRIEQPTDKISSKSPSKDHSPQLDTHEASPDEPEQDDIMVQ